MVVRRFSALNNREAVCILQVGNVFDSLLISLLMPDSDVMQEYHDNIGDLDGPEEKEKAQGRTKEIIAALS
uniref:Uncharacterized protein n=1 Tax=Aegilops tauschii subsp. strangulata TaxID=200361 RepID=A0A453T4E9_AEGTS